MRRSTTAAVMLALVGAVGVAQAADTPIGTWKIKVAFGNRTRVSILKLKLDGDELTGVMLYDQGRRTKIEDASYKDGQVHFRITRQWNGRRSTTQYRGTVSQDTIKGETTYQRRGETRTVDWEAKRTTEQELAQQIEPPPVEADIDLSDENYAVWRDHILPDLSEMAWNQIPWLSTFKDGIIAADAAGRPLLLWTMNGHPLGCT